MDLRDLRYFEAIADHQNMRQAAKRLHVTQPALTKCIHRLEEQLDAELFERVGRGIRLTAVGQVLLARARYLRNAMEETRREVRDFAQGIAGHVRIGAAATVAQHLLPDLCRELLIQAPQVTLEIVIGMNDVLRESLRSGQLDLIVGPLPDNEEFAAQPIVEDEVVVIAPRSHPLTRGKISLQQLCDYRWVLPAPTVATRHWLDRTFELNGLAKPNVQIETNSIILLPRLIAETELLSFISRRNLGPGRAGDTLVELPLAKTTMHRRFGTLYRRDGYLSPAAQHLLGLLSQRGAQILDGPH